MSIHNPLVEAFTAEIGRRHKLSSLKAALNDSTLTYRAEVDHEIEEIYERSDRMHAEVTRKCEQGKLAEIAARSIINPATNTPWLKKAKKKYHDCITDWGTLVEVKHRIDVEGTIHRFLTHDAVHYNKSKYLLLYVSDAEHLWLDRIVDVEAALSTQTSIEKIYSATQHTVQLAGSSFTIYLSQLKSFEERGILEIVFTDGVKKWVKPVEWFYKNKRESNSGVDRGGYYVYKNQVIA